VKVLVTGATSLIGKYLVQQLLTRGDEVTVVQRGTSGLEKVREVRVDLSAAASSQTQNEAFDSLEAAMQGQEAVVHLAAKVGVSGQWKDYEAINIQGVECMAKAARRNGVSRFVHVSTPSVAHAGKSLVGSPAGSAEPEQVRGHYARSKALGEQIALTENCQEMSVVSLRPHLVWGPGDTQLVQRIIERARAGRLVLVGGGLALIDTTFVSNASSALVSGIDNAHRAAGQALVISNGQPRTVKEIIQRMLQAAGMPIKLKSIPAPLAIAGGAAIEKVWDVLDKQGDPPMTRFMAEQLATAHWFDQKKTQELLNWQPEIGIEQGFALLAASLKS